MSPQPAVSPKRPILLIEDEPSVIAFLRAALKRRGYTVVDASSGEEGLKQLATGKYAGVISDIRMPGAVNGADVHEWPIGQQVRVGGALFEIAMVCDPCIKMEAIRPGLQAELDGKRGMLARVLETGDVAAGDQIELL